MDGDRFDLLARALAAAPSRRAMTQALAGFSLAGGLSALLGQHASDARKKGKKKKKKCKKSKKKCGKKCIPKTSCCKSSECGGGATCQNGTCLCTTGQKDCQGTCIPEDDCCPACTDGRVCVAETCECPEGQQECEGSCIPETDCCPACPTGTTCDSGFCICDPGTISCGAECCDSETEVCHGDSGVMACQAGTCPATDWCNVPDYFLCEQEGCACTTTVGLDNACVDGGALSFPISCDPCATNDDCGPNEVCVPGNDGQGPDEWCGCDNNFCVPLCEADAFQNADRATAASPKSGSANRGNGRQRAGRKRRR